MVDKLRVRPKIWESTGRAGATPRIPPGLPQLLKIWDAPVVEVQYKNHLK